MTPTGYGPHNTSVLRVRVLYADTDKMGVVYHANYFRWFEALRGAYMRRRGRPYSDTESAGYQLPLVECGIRYFKPALYEDVLEVRGWVADITAVSVRFEYAIYRQETRIVTGFTRHATINAQGRPVRLPEPVRQALCSAERVDDGVYEV